MLGPSPSLIALLQETSPSMARQLTAERVSVLWSIEESNAERDVLRADRDRLAGILGLVCDEWNDANSITNHTLRAARSALAKKGADDGK